LVRQAHFELVLGCAMPALLAGQPPNCRERGRAGNLMIDLDRVVAPREPLRGALQGAGEQVAVLGFDPIIKQKRRQPVGDRGEGGHGEGSPLYHSS
jgi:hypothetical protein